MSVEVDGREIWDPALRVARIFVGQIRLLETLVDVPSGVAGPENDFIYIDQQLFRNFLLALFERLDRTRSRSMRAMVRGGLQVALALDARANGNWLAVPSEFVDLLDEASCVIGPIANEVDGKP